MSKFVYSLMLVGLGLMVLNTGLIVFEVGLPRQETEEVIEEPYVIFSPAGSLELGQTLEERLQALQNTISACCGTENRNLAVDEEVEYLKKLEKRIEELEIRLMVLEEPEVDLIGGGLVEVIEDGETVTMTMAAWIKKHPGRTGFWDCADDDRPAGWEPCDGRFFPMWRD